jgi:hypothetical protein
MAANIFFESWCHCTAFELSTQHKQQVLTLGRPLDFAGCNIVLRIFSERGSPDIEYVLMLVHSYWINYNVCPTIIDSPLILIWRR